MVRSWLLRKAVEPHPGRNSRPSWKRPWAAFVSYPSFDRYSLFSVKLLVRQEQALSGQGGLPASFSQHVGTSVGSELMGKRGKMLVSS